MHNYAIFGQLEKKKIKKATLHTIDNRLKEKKHFNGAVMILSFLDEYPMANSADQDQTVPRGAV